MGIYDRDYMRNRTVGGTDAAVSTFSGRVYGWMTIGLASTALIAYFLMSSGLYATLMPFWWVFAFGTLGIALAISGMIDRISFGGAVGMFLAYAGLEGLFFGVTLPLYASAYGGQVIWLAFGTAAVVSCSAVIYGVTTKSDLTSMGRLLTFGVMALLGVTFIYFIMSFFMSLGWLHLLISYVGLALFIGLTAYDAQQIRYLSRQADIESIASYKLSIIMALKMYINVIMIFWYLLQIFSRRD